MIETLMSGSGTIADKLKKALEASLTREEKLKEKCDSLLKHLKDSMIQDEKYVQMLNEVSGREKGPEENLTPSKNPPKVKETLRKVVEAYGRNDISQAAKSWKQAKYAEIDDQSLETNFIMLREIVRYKDLQIKQTQELKTLRKTLKEKEEEIEILRLSLASIPASSESDWQDQVEAYEMELKVRQERIHDLTHDLESFKLKEQRLQKEKSKLENEIIELRKQMIARTAELRKFVENPEMSNMKDSFIKQGMELSSIQQQFEDSQNEILKYRRVVQEKEAKTEELLKQLLQEREQRVKLSEETSTLRKTCNILEEKANSLEKLVPKEDLNKLKEQLRDTEQALVDQNSFIYSLQEEIQGLNQTKASLEAALAASDSKKQDLYDEIIKLIKQVADYENRFKNLKAETSLDKLNEVRSQNEALLASINKLENENHRITDLLKQQESDRNLIISHQNSISSLQSDNFSLQEKLENSEKARQKLADEIARLRSQILTSDKEQQLENEYAEKFNELRTQLDNLLRNAKKLESDKEKSELEHNSALCRLQEDIYSLQQDKSILEVKLAASEANKQKLYDETLKLVKQVSECEQKEKKLMNPEHNSKYLELRSDNQSLQITVRNLQLELQSMPNLRKELEELRSRYSSLSKSVTSFVEEISSITHARLSGSLEEQLGAILSDYKRPVRSSNHQDLIENIEQELAEVHKLMVEFKKDGEFHTQAVLELIQNKLKQQRDTLIEKSERPSFEDISNIQRVSELETENLLLNKRLYQLQEAVSKLKSEGSSDKITQLRDQLARATLQISNLQQVVAEIKNNKSSESRSDEILEECMILRSEIERIENERDRYFDECVKLHDTIEKWEMFARELKNALYNECGITKVYDTYELARIVISEITKANMLVESKERAENEYWNIKEKEYLNMIEQLKSNINRLESQQDTEMSKLSHKIQKLKSQKAAMKKELGDARNSHNSLAVGIENSREKVSELERELKRVNEANQKESFERGRRVGYNEAIEYEKEHFDNENKRLHAMVQQYKERLDELNLRTTEVQSKLAGKSSLKEERKLRDDLSSELRRQAKTVEQLMQDFEHSKSYYQT
jgi:chromosome segregation ATPase